jgi:hypothetical protein
MQNSVAKGTLFVVAAGNAGSTRAVMWPAAFASQSWINGQIIVTGAMEATVASNGTTTWSRASFSNYDLALAAWTVYAPGVGLATTWSGSRDMSSAARKAGRRSVDW